MRERALDVPDDVYGGSRLMPEDPGAAWTDVSCLRPYNPYWIHGGVNPAFKRPTDGRPYAVAVIRLPILTGCRKRETLHRRWEQVDLEAGELRPATVKTGTRRASLSPRAVRVPKSNPRSATSPWVVPAMVDIAGVCRRALTVLHSSRTLRAGTHRWNGASTLRPSKPTRVLSPTNRMLTERQCCLVSATNDGRLCRPHRPSAWRPAIATSPRANPVNR